METPKSLIEAALFMSDKSIPKNELAEIASIDKNHVDSVIEELNKDYSQRSMEIIETADGFTMRVKQQLAPKVSHLTPHADISPGPLRTLAIVAFKQPVKQSDIVTVQGNRVYDYIKELENRNLITGKRIGKTKIFTTTQEFNNYFGMPIEKVREISEKLKEELKKANGDEDSDNSKKKSVDQIQNDLEKYFTKETDDTGTQELEMEEN